jgi:hypothetical protein
MGDKADGAMELITYIQLVLYMSRTRENIQPFTSVSPWQGQLYFTKIYRIPVIHKCINEL